MIRPVVLCFVCGLLACLQVKAQEQKPDNLSQLHLSAGYIHVLHFSPGTLDYKPVSMARATLGANYLKGYIRYNLQYASLKVYNQQPECNMFDNGLSYLYYIHLYKGLFVYGGGQVGLNLIHFGENNLYENRDFETEVSAGIEAGTELKIGRHLGVTCSYKLQRIFATPRNDLSILDIGVIYYFTPSNKLKTWLE